jgi:hypothetical protein
MSAAFTMGFQPGSLAEIAQMYGFKTLLEPEVQAAMAQAGQLLAQAAVANTWQVFENPSGALAGTITPVLDSPYEVQIGSDSPYARRREYGFSGKTDSLGRFYAHDPAKPYMQPALDDNEQAVLALIEAAVLRAFARMGAG